MSDKKRTVIFVETNLFSNIQPEKTDMNQWSWEHLNNEDIKDEITLAETVIAETLKNAELTGKIQQSVVDYYLDKLKSLYDEQRKRGIIRKN